MFDRGGAIDYLSRRSCARRSGTKGRQAMSGDFDVEFYGWMLIGILVGVFVVRLYMRKR